MTIDLSRYAWDPRSIPFIRVHSNGKKGLSEVKRSKEITELAQQFIALGGRFMIAEVEDEHRRVEVELVATTFNTLKQPVLVARETSDNGPMLMKAVDRLVRSAASKVDLAQ